MISIKHNKVLNSSIIMTGIHKDSDQIMRKNYP